MYGRFVLQTVSGSVEKRPTAQIVDQDEVVLVCQGRQLVQRWLGHKAYQPEVRSVGAQDGADTFVLLDSLAIVAQMGAVGGTYFDQMGSALAHHVGHTKAAADFLKDIYDTDAQASGLLVMASYNWGPTAIKKRIKSMPENPRDRNFWNLLKNHKIPKETYDYVFYIVSAAVIGENPPLFGFDFKNPLADIDSTGTSG